MRVTWHRHDLIQGQRYFLMSNSGLWCTLMTLGTGARCHDWNAHPCHLRKRHMKIYFPISHSREHHTWEIPLALKVFGVKSRKVNKPRLGSRMNVRQNQTELSRGQSSVQVGLKNVRGEFTWDRCSSARDKRMWGLLWPLLSSLLSTVILPWKQGVPGKCDCSFPKLHPKRQIILLKISAHFQNLTKCTRLLPQWPKRAKDPTLYWTGTSCVTENKLLCLSKPCL